jgi:hypothetical protein
VIVRSAENFHSEADIAAFVDRAAAAGITTLSVLAKQDEDRDIPSGAVFYRSAIAPAAAGYENFDVLATLVPRAHARGLRVQAWIPQFHDQVAARRQPAWQMMTRREGRIVPYAGVRQTEYFVNPLDPEVQAYERSIIAEVVSRYAVDGVMLDWLRFDNYDMDLGELSRRQFQALGGRDPLAIDHDRDSAARRRWNAFRQDGIAAYVASVRRMLPSGMELGVYILPPEFAEVGQDGGRFAAQVDHLAPMCYAGDWQFALPWIWENCLADTVARAGPAAVVPTLDATLDDGQFRQLADHLRRDFPGIRTIAWFFHDRWPSAEIDRAGTRGR